MLTSANAHCKAFVANDTSSIELTKISTDFFDRLMVNNTWSESWEYIRWDNISFFLPLSTRNTHETANRHISPNEPASNPPIDYDYIIPVVDPSLLDLRCGRNASKVWSPPKTATIKAGDTVGFAVNTSVGSPVIGAPLNPWDV
jgi:hypothetical protein